MPRRPDLAWLNDDPNRYVELIGKRSKIHLGLTDQVVDDSIIGDCAPALCDKYEHMQLIDTQRVDYDKFLRLKYCLDCVAIAKETDKREDENADEPKPSSQP